jgi:threonine/homoserine/homoserine lactone efflux protein
VHALPVHSLGTLPSCATVRNTWVVFVHFGAFVAIALLLSMTPGPDTALVTRNALVAGRRAGAFTILGIGLGLVVWTFAASVGVTAVLRASEPAFVAVKVVGSAYLIYLGGQALWVAFRGDGPRVQLAPPGAHRIPPAVAFRQGAVCNLGNPKIAIFFSSFLPQFARGDHPSFAALMLLGLAFSAIGLAWLSLYNLAIAKAGEFLRRPTVRRVVEGITGTVLIAFGLRLAAENR